MDRKLTVEDKGRLEQCINNMLDTDVLKLSDMSQIIGICINACEREKAELDWATAERNGDVQ